MLSNPGTINSGLALWLLKNTHEPFVKLILPPSAPLNNIHCLQVANAPLPQKINSTAYIVLELLFFIRKTDKNCHA